eukprot:403353608
MNNSGGEVKYYDKAIIDQIIIDKQYSIDLIWILTATLMIFMMKIGFAMLETGSVREKNTSNILLKNSVDFFTGVLIFYIMGYGLMEDQQGGVFVLLNKYFNCEWVNGRANLCRRLYFLLDDYDWIYIYPICAGWAWGGGWLKTIGFLDFSGSGIVHLVGGVAGLAGTVIIGPRLGIDPIDNIQQDLSNDPENREQQQNQANKTPLFIQSNNLPLLKRIKIFKQEYQEFKSLDDNIVGHFIKLYDQNFDQKFQYFSMALIVSGGYLLWVCWLFFNGVAGKTLTKHSETNIIQKTIMNTMISGSVSSLVVFFLQPYFMQKVQKIYNYNPVNIVNGLLGGLISITGSSNNVENYSAFIIGFLGGLFYILASYIWHRLKIDDPLHASQLHAFCGLWGVLAVGIFDKDYGLIYTGSFKQIGIQAAGALALIFWSSFLSIPYFYFLNKMKRLRVAPIYEIIGLDTLMHEEIDKFNYISDKSVQILDHQHKQKLLLERSLSQKSSIRINARQNSSLRSSSSTIRNAVRFRSSYYSQSEVDILMDGLNKDIDLVWMLVCSIFIFLMQMGFAMLEAGTVRTKNSSNILLKNMLDTYIGAISYYLVGYGLANNAQGGLLGKAAFASHNFTQKDFLDWIFQYSVCSNITTIVAGSLAERTFVDTYMFFAMLMTSIIYPIVASWTIGGGWLSLFGFIDFAGAAYVHLLGGCCGFIGTIILGPRLGIFGQTQQQNQQSLKINQRKPRVMLHQRNSSQNNKINEFTLTKRNFIQDGDDLQEIFANNAKLSRKMSINESEIGNQIQEEELDELEEIQEIQNQIVLKNKRSFSIASKDQNFLNRKHEIMHNDEPAKLKLEKKFEQLQMPVLSPDLNPSEMPYYDLPSDNIKDETDQSQIKFHYDPHALNRKLSKNKANVKVGKDSYGKLFISPRHAQRIQKIREEFPEFKIVDDRQLNQIIKLYDTNIKAAFRPNSVPLIVQGTMFLWLCWLFFNGGSTISITSKISKNQNEPSKVIMNTIISSASSCISVLLFRPLIMKYSDLTNRYPAQSTCNSLLAGLVSITAVADSVEPWQAFVIGVIGNMIYCLACRIFLHFKIDDPLEASQIHAFCGLWGVLAVGLFHNEKGLFITWDGSQLLKQFIGSIAIIFWATITSFTYFYLLKRLNKFRVGHIYEITGMDVLMHGGTDLLSNDMINQIEQKQRTVANRNHK